MKTQIVEDKIVDLLSQLNEKGIDNIIKEFYDLMFQLIKNEDENIKIVYYEFAKFLLQCGILDRSLEFFVKSYQKYYKQEQIICILYDNFILPQQEIFKKNYIKNKVGYTEIDYNELPIEFILVENNVYYIFHKIKKVFYGKIDMNSFHVISAPEESFYSLLIANQTNFIELLSIILKHKGQICYIIADKENELISYLKLPHFSSLFLENVIIFKDEQIMKLYFKEYSDIYLPKLILAGEDEKIYQEYFHSLHNERIEEKIERKREAVILSFCIPSYNRGHRAIQLVKQLLESQFDAEIEIVVSNNGSTENKEGYEQIKNIKDTRLKYHEFEENQGVVENCCKVIELAQGKFCVIVSDEDTVRLEAIDYYLYQIFTNPQMAIIHANTGACTDCNQKEVYIDRKETINSMGIQSYIGGHIYNKYYIQQYNILEKMRLKKENALTYTYPQGFLEMHLVLCGAIMKAPHLLIIQQQQEPTSVFLEKTKYSLPSYSLGAARVKQAKGMAEIIIDLCSGFKLDLIEKDVLYCLLCSNYYHLLTLSTKEQLENKENMLHFADELLDIFYSAIFKIFYDSEQKIKYAIEILKRVDGHYREYYLQIKNKIDPIFS